MSNHIWIVVGLIGGAMGYGLIFGSDLRIAAAVSLGLVVGYAYAGYVHTVMK